jgi:hypothetical protein
MALGSIGMGIQDGARAPKTGTVPVKIERGRIDLLCALEVGETPVGLAAY